ncbi:MAG TPA: efflux RND transporter permease subunit [Arcobacter sp.]|nr:efflux RND transporter permease subunit [Arcobacter sp.]
MLERFIRFFVENSRMNYTLFILIFAIGIWSYQKMPKEIFPTFELDMVSINGSYAGTSVDVLDKMAVGKIEDNVKSLDGIKDVTAIVSPGRFSIVLELKKGLNRYNMADKIKDAVALSKNDLPGDMNEPSVTIVERQRDLMDIALTSNTLNIDQMKPFAQKLKTQLLEITGINEVTIFGDSDKFFEIQFDDEKLEAYGIDKNEFFSALSKLSYIFPLGKIEDKEKHFYISTYNGAKSANELANTTLKLSTGQVYIRDVAYVSKKYEDASTLYSFNAKSALALSVKQADTANAIEIVKKVNELINKIQPQQKQIHITISNDNSERIVDRLNIVGSNIIFGIILITVLVALLINTRMSFIIAIGIPTSFVIASVYLYFFGYSINMISLVGVLLAIGIVVDDAIVVSENIQQHIEEGIEPKEAAIKGATEMFMPVTIASLTTLFAFLPALMLSGQMGEVIKLIPIALSSLVVASLIEAFIFLPIHAAHTLKVGAKTTSWERANKIYNSIIHFFMNWKKTFLIIFIILVPLATVMVIKNSKFQMFPKFDASNINLSIKANENTTLEESFKIVKELEKELLSQKENFHIKSIDSRAGFRRDGGGNTEKFPYVMYMNIEFTKLKADNVVDKYITPYLSFYYDDEGRTRDLHSNEIAKRLKKFIQKNSLKEKYKLEEIDVLERRVGPVKSDVKIGLLSNDNQKTIKYINKLQNEIQSIKGVKSVQNSLRIGIDEIKIKINSYGEQLGLSEKEIGSYLANMYLLKKTNTVFDETEMLDVKIQSKNKDDYSKLKNIEIPINNNQFVRLNEVCNLTIQKSFDQIVKDNGEKNFYVYANVNPKIITSTEVVEQIQPLLKEIKQAGIQIRMKGEAQKKKELQADMKAAGTLALLLILLSLLYLFNSFRETFILMSVIPFSFLGVLIGHQVMGLNLTMPSIIGALGLAGVVINDGIIMMTYLKKAKDLEEVMVRAAKRFRPIILTTITTLVGMSALIFYPTGQAVIFQPLAISLGFGLLWGTVLNLIYLPVLYSFSRRLR